MRRWDGLLEKYVRGCEMRGLASGTVKQRASELGRFGQWLKRRRPRRQLGQVESDLVVKYIQERSAFRSRSTVYGVVSQLRGMGEFLVQEGIWSQNPLRWIRGPKLDRRHRLPVRINNGDLKALWAAAQGRRGEHARYQAVCILAVLYGTGMRRGELERLDVSDWDSDNAILNVDGQKTGHARAIAVSEGVWRCIEAYLPRRQNQLEKMGRLEEQALLVNRNGVRVNGQNIMSLMKRLAASAGVPAVTALQFRHSCASDLLEAGVTLPEVQRMLGHTTIQTTVRYIDIADTSRAAAIEKHPLNEILGNGTGEVRS